MNLTRSEMAVARFQATGGPRGNPRRVNFYGHFKQGAKARRLWRKTHTPIPGAFGKE